ncbi:glycosyltransferase family 4 protein [Acinetobacter sp. YH12103]|uniref:glycosyltransferase family 4 protein n=1 Tax=Acinetobacter sp. YH12103 TaxID=2601092 RepID=UPI0015D29819|nr:glycosyltransferase family 4 protein [Acinetobacter sp. YH12103]
MIRENKKPKIKVALIVDEYFGAVDTAFGGYGFLARRHIAKYLPNSEIEIEVLLGKGKYNFQSENYMVDGIKVYKLPRRKWFASRWLAKKDYTLYLSIELTYSYILECEKNIKKKLVLWIQDPRPQYEWDEINTVKLFPEPSYYNQKIYDLVNTWYRNDRVKFISQGYFLNEKAIDLYDLDKNIEIEYLPNPIDIDPNFVYDSKVKENIIIFLGRIESVKRGWLFCEIAKKLPQYQFYVLGKTFRDDGKNSQIIQPYFDLPNLNFVGHVDGEEKESYLKRAKILINTSIHEALPISFLEALSYGTLLVSNRNPENLTQKFGVYVGNVLGDGFDKVDLYCDAVNRLMDDDILRDQLAVKAIQYINEVHNVENFVKNTRNIILREVVD